MDSISARDWAILVKQQEASGKTARRWCAEQGLSYSTFMYHRKKLLTDAEVTKGSFLELAEDTNEPTWLEITMYGARLSLAKKFNKAVLIRLLEILRTL